MGGPAFDVWVVVAGAGDCHHWWRIETPPESAPPVMVRSVVPCGICQHSTRVATTYKVVPR